jgi:hypothetical protein
MPLGQVPKMPLGQGAMLSFSAAFFDENGTGRNRSMGMEDDSTPHTQELICKLTTQAGLKQLIARIMEFPPSFCTPPRFVLYRLRHDASRQSASLQSYLASNVLRFKHANIPRFNMQPCLGLANRRTHSLPPSLAGSHRGEVL